MWLEVETDCVSERRKKKEKKNMMCLWWVTSIVHAMQSKDFLFLSHVQLSVTGCAMKLPTILPLPGG